MDLSKEQTLQFKGFAILFMLITHLFGESGNINLTEPIVYIGNTPLVSYIALLTPIRLPIFLVLSGYGLYLSSIKPKQKTMYQRLLPLMINYWIVLILFVGLGHYMKPSVYPGSFDTFILNVLAWSSSYNGEWWFLFPYLVLVILSPCIFKMVKIFNSYTVFILSGIMYGVTYMLIWFNRDYLYNNSLVYQPLLVFNMSFTFILGALAAKEQLFLSFKIKINSYTKRVQLFLLIGISLLIILKYLVSVSVFNPIFAFIFMLLFASLKHWNWMDKVLVYLAKNSTNIWLTHSFFCYYLFKNFIYGFKYPLVIFLVLIGVSLCSSYVINWIYKPIIKFITERGYWVILLKKECKR